MKYRRNNIKFLRWKAKSLVLEAKPGPSAYHDLCGFWITEYIGTKRKVSFPLHNTYFACILTPDMINFSCSSVRGVHTRRKQGISVRLMQYACWWSVPPIPPERMINHAATHLSALNRLQPAGRMERKELSFTLHQRNTETASPPRLAVSCSAW